jgi:ABC-type multidrug transport system ATPase subunit
LPCRQGRVTLAGVLALQNITLQVGSAVQPQTLLHDVSLQIPPGHLTAIVGPAGSGKSTLVKVIAGVYVPTAGTVHWQGRDLAEEDLAPYDIGYVPQFSIAFDHLTIWESMNDAMRLRVKGLSGELRYVRAESILREVGLFRIADRRVRVLSGGEKRRLGLALELVSYPSLLIADEVTSGLDPKSEEEIMNLMHRLSQNRDRIVLNIIHNLRHIALCDSVIVMHLGHLVYHGPTARLTEYFGVNSPEEVFPKLATKSAEEWHADWLAHRDAYDILRHPPAERPAGPVAGGEEPAPADTADWRNLTREVATPNPLRQFFVLVGRRWRIFFRDRSQVWLHLALLFGFPCLVVIFALEGLPQIQNLSMTPDVNVLQQLKEANAFIVQSTKVGRLVSGLVMVQVVLLTLMGSNNSAREIAAERLIFEKEKLGGLHPLSYLASKALFLLALVAVQSFWMAVFVNRICRFPGDLVAQIVLLFLANGALTATCLAISSLMKSPEQASLVSIYLVGFQLPLSGAVLALPEVFRWLTRPFIAAYWSWAGVLQTMKDTRFYDVVLLVTPTELAPLALCFWALGCHVIIGLIVAYLGCVQSRWE